MLQLDVSRLGRAGAHVLALGAHPDDIEIGAGGALLRLRALLPQATFRWLVLSGTPQRHAEAREAAEAFGADHVELRAFPDAQLPAHAEAVKQELRLVADGAGQPDLVIAPWRHDRHQDHRLLGELVWQVFRGSAVWCYEVPKWEGDLATPNLYVTLDDAVVDHKLALLQRCFPSQRGKDWFDADVFRGLLRLRGVECRARWAEGFHADKVVV